MLALFASRISYSASCQRTAFWPIATQRIVLIVSPQKVVFNSDGVVVPSKHINGYLMDGADIVVESRTKPLCDIPLLISGNRPSDGGHLILEPCERDEIIKNDPGIEKYIRRFTMGYEFINNIERYCLWLVNATPREIREHPVVLDRVERCRIERLASTDKSRVKLADVPHLFREQLNPARFVAIPKVSSQRRQYIPCGYLGSDTIAGDKLFMIPDGGLVHFGVLTSSVHMAWMRVVCGRLKSDYSYSINIVYNNFPWPGGLPGGQALPSRNVSGASALIKSRIERTAQGILDARALYPDSSLADLYDPLTMPPELRKAHQANDAAVMKAYGFDPELSEPQIVAKLFEMYAALTR